MTELPDGRARAAKIAFALAVGALVVLLGVLFALSLRGDDEVPSRQVTIEPAEETSTETSSAPSTEVTAPVEPGDTKTPSPPQQDNKVTRVAKIAFRLGGTIYVANEDGTSAAPVIRSAEGPYALSPDARTLAVVEASTLKLVPVAGGKQATIKGVESARPIWAPDSTQVLFVRGDASSHGVTTVMSVKPDGSGAKALRQGMGVRVSPNGKVVAMLPPPAENPTGASTWVYVSTSGGSFKKVSVKGFVTAVAATDDGLLIGTATEQGQMAVISTNLSGAEARQLAGDAGEQRLATWSEISVAPDGRYAIAMAMGDDGYSRATALSLESRTSRELFPRKDTYFHAWSAEGTRVYFVEGNYFQGESTSLVTVGRDGTGRRVVVTGAEP